MAKKCNGAFGHSPVQKFYMEGAYYMRGLVWTNEKKLELREVETPGLKGPYDVKVRIYGTGICGTDLNILRGKVAATPGMIIGHEAVGTVVEIGSGVTRLSEGDRVVIDPTQFCGKCYYCRKGLTCFCETFDDYQLGIGTHGTFADYYVGEERFMYKIPHSMSWETAVLVEPLTCVMNIFQKSGVKPDDSVLIIGSGPIGILCQMVSRRLSRLTAAVEIDKYRADMSRKYAHYVFHPDELTEEKVYEINYGRKFDVIIDAVGNQLKTAASFIAKGGRIVPMGFDETYSFTFNPFSLLSRGISIIGAGEVHQMTEAALQYASSLENVHTMVTSKYSLEKYKEAFDQLMGYDLETGARKEIRDLKVVLLSD
ncbi:2-desacetyl-2-hydroxyethyl bacteriochlorophyllide A dehydrogenase [Anaerobacterium chartisolvens]|uniref:2-desacetyl-2-hydroxyethyl bacteriochlorophyllide A dehydrogenase n=1 Tax=Anaerobacterium chartisolvens TaxID=1297424 RepID=A0A369AL71_9FIRM|nr:alcohol dehydrogenase catalytic domain-containing protein [Anaerobacterium chartisolvens]RCX09078.1 2-desacetyl-2-hydroxyethyl bacteriochlorophyllide A dehydrogenase [Anaerobacterium chartisolvens]